MQMMIDVQNLSHKLIQKNKPAVNEESAWR